ncbi:MAG TPA: hypothetical protein VFP80_11430 [Thermoanaerobaculia bacterium]|nr:hypothetical protein [Thermoanaerobaculia bacterium]
MRTRALAVVFFLAVLVTTAGAETVRLLRYDATIEGAAHSALCVVPEKVSKPAARFICYYVVLGKAKQRDNTVAGGERQDPVADPDKHFNTWLKQALPGVTCNLGLIAVGSDLPTQKKLEEACRGAAYTTSTLTSKKSSDFIDDVRKAAQPPLPEVAAPLAPAPAVNTETFGPDFVKTQPVAPVTSTNPPPTTPPVPGDKGKGEDKEGKPIPPDWTVLGLLILIAVLVAALFLDRLSQIVQRKRFLATALAGDDHVRSAANLEQAAVILQHQRDEARLFLDRTKKNLQAAESALQEIDKHLGIAKGEDRAGRAGALVTFEKEVLRLAGGDSPLAAIRNIETKLHERKALDDLLGSQNAAENAVEYVRDCVELVKAFSRPFCGNADGPVTARVATEEIAQGVHRLYSGVTQQGANEQSARTELAAIEQMLRKLHEQADERLRVIESQKQHLDAAGRFMAEEWPDIVPGDLGTTVPIVAARMRDARAAATRAGCATGRAADAIVTELSAMVEQERNASRGAQEMLRRLRDYLALPDQDAEALKALVTAELGKPNRILRLALAAAIPLLRKGLAAPMAEEDASVIRMLRIGEIVDQLGAFLSRLWSYQGDRLWSTGIHSAFAQSWLHNLFRAEAVLRTYFMASRLAELGDVLTLVAWAFRHAITASGYDVDRVQLLAAPSAAMDPMHDSPREFRTCPDIRNRVQAVLKTQRDGGFAVDVDSVGIRDGNRVLKRGAVVLAKRVDWED